MTQRIVWHSLCPFGHRVAKLSLSFLRVVRALRTRNIVTTKRPQEPKCSACVCACLVLLLLKILSSTSFRLCWWCADEIIIWHVSICSSCPFWAAHCTLPLPPKSIVAIQRSARRSTGFCVTWKPACTHTHTHKYMASNSFQTLNSYS